VRWLACNEQDIPVGDAWLVATEQRRRASYRFTKRRTEYLLRRYAGKRAVAAALGLSPDPLSLGRIGMLNRMGGAPYAELDGRAAPFDIFADRPRRTRGRAGRRRGLDGVGVARRRSRDR